MVNDLALISDARNALERARTLDDVKAILDLAVAAKKYAEAKRLGEDSIRYAQEIVNRAIRRMGAVLADTNLHRGGGDQKSEHRSTVTGDDGRIRLADLGITKDQSAQAQQIARIPEPEFERFIAHSENLSISELMRLRKAAQRAERQEALRSRGLIELHSERHYVVYRIRDANQRLLYVGMSTNLPHRLAQHERKPWWRLVAFITLEHCDSLADARITEELAIRTECPIYNRAHNERGHRGK